jgi:tetratricopeptide (TPR) repeat protein
MRQDLLSGAALAALMIAAPAPGLIDRPDPTVRRDSPTLDPLAVAGAICGAKDGPARLGLFIGAARAWAADRAAEGEPALIPGTASDAIDPTASAAARPWFAQGLGLTHGFNHDEAIRAFRKAQAIDPDCAICFWGEAYALGPNINKPMDTADTARASEAARLAREKAGGASDVERALIAALQTRYSDDPAAERADLDRAYAEAMKAVADRFPAHDEAQALYAEAVMDAQPWDYWESDGRTPKGAVGDALARLETVLARNPDQPLAIHLYIHLTEASDNPWAAAPFAERLARLTPGAGHMVHMPSHVWYRIGRFKDSLAVNVAAVKTDEAYLDAAGDAAGTIYRYGYYPHNVHFALTSAQMVGDGPTALAMADRLDAALPMEFADLEGWIQLIKAGPWFARVQFGDDAELESVLSAPKPPDAPAYVEAAWRYARGEAAARLGHAAEAREEAAALAALDAATDWDAAMAYMPAPQLLAIMQDTVRARAAMAEGDLNTAIDHLAAATATQAALPYLEPPFWWYPARQTYAAVLLMDGQAERAEHEFFATLVESPDDGWAYWGLAEARAAQGDAEGAGAARVLWRNAWAGTEPPRLDRL